MSDKEVKEDDYSKEEMDKNIDRMIAHLVKLKGKNKDSIAIFLATNEPTEDGIRLGGGMIGSSLDIVHALKIMAMEIPEVKVFMDMAVKTTPNEPMHTIAALDMLKDMGSLMIKEVGEAIAEDSNEQDEGNPVCEENEKSQS